MNFPRFKKALAALLSPFATSTRRIAIGTTMLTLASTQSGVQANETAGREALAVSDPEVRKYASKYVLRHSPRLGAFIQLISHASHSSHASHASHASHYSGSGGSHYSHYSSSTPPRAPQPALESMPRSAVEEVPTPASFWTEGLPIRPATRDPKVLVEKSSGAVTITMRGGATGAHFNGVFSALPYDLSTLAASVMVMQAPPAGRTRLAVVADADDWYAISVLDTKLVFEKSVNGNRSAKSIPYEPHVHRYWRLRMRSSMFVWETSADGNRWEVQSTERPAFSLSAARVSLSAGTEAAHKLPGMAVFADFHLGPAAP